MDDYFYRDDLETEDTESLMARYDRALWRLRYSSHAETLRLSSFDEAHYLNDVLLLLDVLPKDAWTGERLDSTLSVLYSYAEKDQRAGPWSLHTLLGGKAPAALLRRHLRDLEETLDLGLAQQTYFHFSHQAEIVQELKLWRSKKRYGALDSRNWRAALHPKHNEIDWSLAEDPVATLLALRAAQPHVKPSVKVMWWTQMFAHEKRTSWAGSLRHSTLLAMLEDSSILTPEILNQYTSRCIIDLDFLSRLPDFETHLDAHEIHHDLGALRLSWLEFKIRHLDLIVLKSGEDSETRKKKQAMSSAYNKDLASIDDCETLVRLLRVIFNNANLPEDFALTGMHDSWKKVVRNHLTAKDKDALQLLFDDLDTSAAARTYISTLNVSSGHNTELPENLVDDFIFNTI